jgi:hypothetical protein
MFVLTTWLKIKVFFKAVFRSRIHLTRIRIQHFKLNTDPDPDLGVLMTKNLKKFMAEKKINFVGSETTIYLSLGLHKGRPGCGRSLSPSKENIQHFKT